MQRTQSTATVLDPASAIDWPIEQPLTVRGAAVRDAHTIHSAAAATGRFLLHFLEMGIAMGIGMAIFGPFKVVLVDQGDTALLDRSSIDYQFWMNLFMVVPMVLWMRTRGHRWRHGAEMGGAMVIPTACVLLLYRVGVSDVLPWFTTSLTGIAMLGGMIGYMLYRHEMYTGGYSFAWLRRRGATA
jgi:hypothetical protein